MELSAYQEFKRDYKIGDTVVAKLWNPETRKIEEYRGKLTKMTRGMRVDIELEGGRGTLHGVSSGLLVSPEFLTA